jgi:hypothetical protein
MAEGKWLKAKIHNKRNSKKKKKHISYYSLSYWAMWFVKICSNNWV